MRHLLATLLLAVGVADAQEGFPLDGTWRGQRTAVGEPPTTVVVVLQWDGKSITGVINPGPKALPLRDAQLIPEGWRVTFATTNAAGEPIQFEGRLEDLGSYHRRLVGNWTEGGRRYDFRMARE